MNKDIIITNKERITPRHKAEHEPFEYKKYEITERQRDNQCYAWLKENAI